MTRAPVGWGIAGEIESVFQTPSRAGARQVAASRSRAVQIAYWLGAQQSVPSVAEIIERWRVSRPTAYRWRAFAESGGTQFPHSHKAEGIPA